MNFTDYITELLPKTINFKFARAGFMRYGNPITLTYSVTGMCQSNCRTCYIGREYQKNPERIREFDLKLDEIEKFFKSIGRVYFLNISGGEPYLRRDLAEIIELAMKHLKPKIVHIPTNAYLPERIESETRKILKTMGNYNHNVPLTVKPSIDGIGTKHDEIRGLKGNFARLVETIRRLKTVDNDFPNFHLELGTVVSNFNITALDEIEDWVHKQGVQSYRNEIAEQREEFFNIGEKITPSNDVYRKLMVGFKQKIEENLKTKRSLARMTESLRLVYYDLVVKILEEKKQVIPCYAGISNVHINYDGQVWPCCVLGYAKPMGSLRENNYDFHKIWHSEEADEVRKYIRDGNCACPLANQAYSNILCSSRYLFTALRNFLTLA